MKGAALLSIKLTKTNWNKNKLKLNILLHKNNYTRQYNNKQQYLLFV